MIAASQFLNYFGMDDCTDISLNMLGKSIISIPLLTKAFQELIFSMVVKHVR